MRFIATTLFLALLFVTPILAQNKQDKSNIQSVTEDYLTAWYQGDEELMSTVVHSQMAKKIVFDTGNNQGALAYLTAKDLLAQTRKKKASDSRKERSESRYNYTGCVQQQRNGES